ncbi:PTS sugar transporter subunit IIB [Lacticaseibacillus kribbianus]|uniref:PTS sugar transporter subunit IIB n=1 Tax=Lacticaseibacillus kribbianus TaxID=2926292 RepID=UPI001CD2D484|nr:PTS sugar transporter subunit IIB [Lacticaseibacillus kribbianus]
MTKLTIMLACAGGMSSSLLVTKMQAAAKDRGLDAEIFAVGASAVPADVEKFHPDVVMLGPQIRYMFAPLSKKVAVPVAMIEMRDYGTMNGEKVLTAALALIEKASA